MKKSELKVLKRKDLEKLADEYGVKYDSKMKKEDLVEQLAKASKKSATPSSSKKAAKEIQTSMKNTNNTMEGESKKFEIEDKGAYSEPSYQLVGEEAYELPNEYGDTKIMLLVQDPYWMHAYWEINDETRKKFKIERGKHQQLTIRVFNVNTRETFDVNVSDDARSWYFRVPSPGQTYYAEIGVFDDEGKFQALAQSNYANVPTDKASDIYDEEWLPGELKRAEELFKKSGGYVLHKQVGSGALAEWAVSPSAISSAGSGSGGVAAKELPPKQRKFWAELHTELIVYGATEPDAQVMLGGVPIKLSPDGTFSLRFYLKDGDHSVPFVATSNDGVDTIEITPFVGKRTQRLERKNK